MALNHFSRNRVKSLCCHVCLLRRGVEKTNHGNWWKIGVVSEISLYLTVLKQTDSVKIQSRILVKMK
jgi:hypothetical protein